MPSVYTGDVIAYQEYAPGPYSSLDGESDARNDAELGRRKNETNSRYLRSEYSCSKEK